MPMAAVDTGHLFPLTVELLRLDDDSEIDHPTPKAPEMRLDPDRVCIVSRPIPGLLGTDISVRGFVRTVLLIVKRRVESLMRLAFSSTILLPPPDHIASIFFCDRSSARHAAPVMATKPQQRAAPRSRRSCSSNPYDLAEAKSISRSFIDSPLAPVVNPTAPPRPRLSVPD